MAAVSPAATLFGPDRVIPPSAPLAAASFIPIAHSISIPTAPSTPHTASISTRSVVVPGPKARGLAAPRALPHLGVYAAVPAPPGPKFCLSVSSIGLSIPNVGWGPTNGRRAQLEMEVEEGGQPCPMTKSNFDPHAPKPTPHLGMLADSRHLGRLGLSRK